MAKRELPSPEVLRQLLRYDPQTGEFKWRKTLGSRAIAGNLAGHKDSKGYLRVWLGGRNYKLHRLAFVCMGQGWPDNQIDHINGEKGDNRWENLRHATNAENQQNTPVRKDSKTGIKGVTIIPGGKFRANIRKDGVLYHLGVFDSKIDAGIAYATAKAEKHSFVSLGRSS